MMFSNISSGYVSGYDKLPTDATIEYRKNQGVELPNKYNIAVLDCSDVGKTGAIIYDAKMIPVNIFDCAGKADGGYDWMQENNIVMEVGWYLWQDYPEMIHDQTDLIIFGER